MHTELRPFRSAAAILSAACLVLCLLLSACGKDESELYNQTVSDTSKMQSEAEPSPEPAREHIEFDDPEIRIYNGELLWGRGFVRGERVYLPFEMFLRELNIDSCWESSGTKVTMETHGMELTADSADDYFIMNGRYIFAPGGFVTVGEDLYMPAEAAGICFNIPYEISEDMSRISLDMRGISVITGGDQYYTLKFDSTDVFWLSRIIFAEATYQSLEGRIAVGNVVLNRVAYSEYPNTIHGVIFDTVHGVQFETAMTGDVYNDADELSVIAAYMALDGVNTAGSSMFFINPKLGYDGWFRGTLEYVTTIGDHDFYTVKGA